MGRQLQRGRFDHGGTHSAPKNRPPCPGDALGPGGGPPNSKNQTRPSLCQRTGSPSKTRWTPRRLCPTVPGGVRSPRGIPLGPRGDPLSLKKTVSAPRIRGVLLVTEGPIRPQKNGSLAPGAPLVRVTHLIPKIRRGPPGPRGRTLQPQNGPHLGPTVPDRAPSLRWVSIRSQRGVSVPEGDSLGPKDQRGPSVPEGWPLGPSGSHSVHSAPELVKIASNNSGKPSAISLELTSVNIPGSKILRKTPKQNAGSIFHIFFTTRQAKGPPSASEEGVALWLK